MRLFQDKSNLIFPMPVRKKVRKVVNKFIGQVEVVFRKYKLIPREQLFWD